MLASPRYGERWAQHWLDVVRYADTHGFEVNTERPHAWPYRDYVIRAFNQDKPYDRFVVEQLAGDAVGEDAATGFLVTASVLLPGQIGADDVSKRLARQDAIDEIVVNIGQTFMGLSIGCARCHDHKFDPISSSDYYAMQAFVAGVEYDDREVASAESEVSRREERSWRARMSEIDRELSRFVPLARPGSFATPLPNARENVVEFEPIVAKFIRFTIHDTLAHPTLGVIEPCVDEFEIISAGDRPRNVALATNKAKVKASGSHVSDHHRLEFVNDGAYGNERSWMSGSNAQGWLEFELPEPTSVAKVIWGRDRKGEFLDRLPTAYTIEVGLDRNQMKQVAHVPPRRPAVQARLNIDRFDACKTKKVRFTIRATNNLEPCIDELEVFNVAGVNIAAQSRNARMTTSGNTIVADRHEPRFVNDGAYGNSRSWMSNEVGRGWLIVEFPQEEEIDRVVWGRDRKGEFTDRLATDYVIEVADSTGEWRVVADASDRSEPGSNSGSNESTFAGLPMLEVAQARRLSAEKSRLEVMIREAIDSRLIFAGKFRKPDVIHLLNRGDPEQPGIEVAPTVLEFLGKAPKSEMESEQSRRMQLASWMADANHPMTGRVMVNRIWQGHFGRGLVDTPSDFGNSGNLPSHPELLDWLANEFVRSGWSIKAMHRLIMTSATYRQAGGHRPLLADTSATPERANDDQASEIDADVALFWRYPSRRLEAECIRDSILFVSGNLNPAMHGRGFDLFDQRGGLSGFVPIESYSGDGLKRMIYAHKVRREPDAIFGAFDCPDAGQSTAKRRASTTPIQAFNLFNSRFTIEQAEVFAEDCLRECGPDADRQVERVFEKALNRLPIEEELVQAVAFVREHGLTTLCRVIFNTNEFLSLP